VRGEGLRALRQTVLRAVVLEASKKDLLRLLSFLLATPEDPLIDQVRKLIQDLDVQIKRAIVEAAADVLGAIKLSVVEVFREADETSKET
jgi:hypothetical protein